MSNVNIELTGIEAACIYAAVSAELDALQQDLKSNDISVADKKRATVSVEVCKEILNKLAAASPNTTYELCK